MAVNPANHGSFGARRAGRSDRMGLADVQARIAEIRSRFASPAVPAAASLSPGAAGSTDFASRLGLAESGATERTAGIGGGSSAHATFAHDLLAALGMPETGENVRAIIAWAAAEGTSAANNPLATTQSMPGATAFNSVGVKDYATYADGIAATVKTLRNGRYDAVLAALSRGDSAVAVGEAVAASPWGTGDGVLRRLGAA